ncbi:MAG: hypothetical protein EOM76_05220 [Sphingobacteriia bacterium]|nr:hypothetical protein [Sphingobacteriia bacterium]
MELELAVNNYNDLSGNIEKDLKSLQSILKKSDEIPDGISYTITYSPNKSVTVKQSAQSEKIIWKDSKQVPYKCNNQCFIRSVNYFLLIRFEDLESITSESLIARINEVIHATDTIQGRFAATYNYTFQNGNLVHNKQLDKLNGQLDAISFKGGVGASLIKNQPVVDISAEIGLFFCKKGIWKNNYYLSYNQLSSFDDNSKVNLNGFANIGYRNNLSNDIKSPNWLGLEFGYLVNRNGDLFEKNTFKFGVNWEIGKYISVSPQLYFSGSSSYPAVRIGFGF